MSEFCFTHATYPVMRGLSDWQASETSNNGPVVRFSESVEGLAVCRFDKSQSFRCGKGVAHAASRALSNHDGAQAYMTVLSGNASPVRRQAQLA